MKKMLLALSLSGALLGGSVAWAEENVTEPTSTAVAEPNSNAATTTISTTAEITPAAPVEATAEPTLNTGDTAWILVSTALVLLMTIPGLALLWWYGS